MAEHEEPGQNSESGESSAPASEEAEQSVDAAQIVRNKRSRRRGKKEISLTQLAVEAGRAKPVRRSLFYYTLVFLYKNLYILGISLVRKQRRARRRVRQFFSRRRGHLYGFAHRIARFVGRIYRGLLHRVRTPFERIGDTYRGQLPAITEARRTGQGLVDAFLPVIEVTARFVWKVLRTLINYLAPVAALVALLLFVQMGVRQPIALRLQYDGHDMGYVQNEAVFDRATQIVRERIVDQASQDIHISSPSFSLVETSSATDYLSSAEIADMMIVLSGDEIEQAFGLYVGNQFLGAVTDKDPILQELDSIRAENATGKPNERVKFAKSIRLKPAIYPAGSVVSNESLIDRVRANETADDTYIVQDGDSPSGIAAKNGMSYDDLIQLNPDIEENLRPGDVLTTAVARPFLPVQNIFREEYTEEIPYETIEVENATYAKGYQMRIQEGVNGLRKVIAEVTTLNGLETDRLVLDNSEIITHPVDERIVIGISDPLSIAGGGSGSAAVSGDRTPSSAAGSPGFIWPTNGGRATTYSGHTNNAIDIAPGGAGHPIYASASGVVVKAQNGVTGYGNHIIIDHQNGYRTLYAHNSVNYVSVGQYVEQGEVIALMGQTGRAYGNHLHFEIHENGRAVNPTAYVGSSG